MSGFELPDMARLYRGHDGLREFWRDWLQAWETVEFKRLVPEDHGDHVIVEVDQRNRGRGSGVDIDFHYFQTFTVRDGKITASGMASTKAEALEAVGAVGVARPGPGPAGTDWGGPFHCLGGSCRPRRRFQCRRGEVRDEATQGHSSAARQHVRAVRRSTSSACRPGLRAWQQQQGPAG